MFEEYPEFEWEGSKLRFVKMHDTRTLMAWRILPTIGSDHQAYLGGLDITSVNVDTLKFLGVWENLSPELQKEVESIVHQEKEQVNGLMEKARAARRKRYVNVPKELVCKCGARISIPPGTLVDRVEKMKESKGVTYSIDDYVKQWQCQKCNPTKGRKANPEIAGLPKELTCTKCKVVKPCLPSSISQRSKQKNLTPKQFLDTYVCQKCNPTKGRKKGQKTKRTKHLSDGK